jgi:hypothetical protein
LKLGSSNAGPFVGGTLFEVLGEREAATCARKGRSALGHRARRLQKRGVDGVMPLRFMAAARVAHPACHDDRRKSENRPML